MSIRNKYENELEVIFKKLTQMCQNIELAIEKSITALKCNDKTLAKEVIEDDKVIDIEERDIEQDCLKILLMEHPVASDFRDVSSALKMITDLERIGDQAADISELSLQLEKGDVSILPQHIIQMYKIVIDMVKTGVQSYINRDLESARSLDKKDDKVDALFETAKQDLVKLITENTGNVEQAILFIMIAKYLERIGDHAVNIGEWAEYAMTGVHKPG